MVWIFTLWCFALGAAALFIAGVFFGLNHWVLPKRVQGTVNPSDLQKTIADADDVCKKFAVAGAVLWAFSAISWGIV